MVDSQDPHARLAALAEAGRAQRQADAAQKERAANAEAAQEAAEAQRHQRLMSYTTWSSLSGFMQLFWWAVFLPFPAMFVVYVVRILPWLFPATLAISVGLALTAVLGTLWARQRDIRFRAALPFSVLGYEAKLSTAARTVRCEIELAAACPPSEMLVNLVRLIKWPTEFQEIKGSVIILGAEPINYSLLDDHCRWVPRWFRTLNQKVLQPVHAVYPIRSVRLR